MKKQNVILTAIISSIALFSLGGCGSLESGYGRMVVEEADKNNDKLMTYNEYYGMVTNSANATEYRIQAKGRDKTVAQYSREEFNKMDSNKDGLVSSEEVKAYTFK